MCWPFGETGGGKIGVRPPTLHELRRNAIAKRPAISSSARRQCVTWVKYIDGRNPASGVQSRRPYKIRGNGGDSQKVSVRRCLQPQPGGGLPTLWAEDGSLCRPLPQLRLQAVALQLHGLRRLQDLA